MNIHELDSYNLGDAVKFNDKLNPRIWGADEKMRPEVREQLLQIADDFREFLGIDVEVKDITVSGSNAAYTYTPHSDIDLHLVVDLPKADESDVYRELFDAKKYAYNDMHNIQIGGYDVELYVQDANKPHHSQGIYSIVNNDWISVPKRRQPEVDDISVKSKFEDLGHRIESAIKSGSYEKMTDLTDKLRDYRQAGLDAHGEFGPENLAFKILRTQGLIKKLYDARNAAKDELLSLDERRKKKKKKKVRYAYGGYWYPGTAYAGQDHPAGTEGGDGGGDGGGESMREDAGMTWDGVSPTTDMFTSETKDSVPSDEDILKDFIDFCVKELKITHMPKIKLRKDPQWPVVHKTFGRYRDEDKVLEVAWGNRHIMDVLRTVAHELTHKRQHERENVPDSAGETGSKYENEANARAGVLMRDYARLHPEYFAHGQADDLHGIEEGWKEKAAGVAAAACIAGTPGCATSPTAGQTIRDIQTIGRTAQTVKNMSRADVDAETKRELELFAKAQTGDHAAQNLSRLYQLQKKIKGQPSPQRIPQNEGASGYIPTKAQAKDPRFSMALTVDIKPGQVGKEANKLKLKTDKQGHPQIARANGLFENLYKEYQQFNKFASDLYEAKQNFAIASQPIPGDKFRLTINNRPFILTPGGFGKQHSQVFLDSFYLTDMKSGKTEFVDSWYNWPLAKAIADHLDQNHADALVRIGKADFAWHEKNNDWDSQPPRLQGIRRQTSVGIPAKDFVKSVDAVKRVTGQDRDLNEDEELDEVRMSPGALEKFAASPEAKGIRAGFEAELIFRDTQGEADELDPEPNYDADERAYSIQQVIEFFDNDEYGYGLSDRGRRRLEDELDETYMNWRDEQMMEDFKNEADDLVRKVIEDEEWDWDDAVRNQLDDMGLSDDEIEKAMEAGNKAPRFTKLSDQDTYAQENPGYQRYLEAYSAAESILDDLVEESVKEQDKYWDAALDDFRDNYSGDDDSFFSDVGLRWMSDIANEFNLDWPVWNMDAGRNEGSRDWETIGALLQDAVDMPVKVSSNYHSTARREGQWIIEPDGSLSPDDPGDEAGLEIVSPPMPLLTAIEKLRAVVDWANNPKTGNAYTNSSTGLHMGVSLPKFTSEDSGDDAGIDYVKLILFMGDKYILDKFGRSANNYTASALDKLKQNIRGKRSDPAGVVKLLQHGLAELAHRELQKGVGTSKYTSAHIQPGYIEFRSPGGDWLAKADEEIGVLENTMMRFARAMAIAGDPNAERQEYAKKLYKLVTEDNPEYADQLKLFSEFSAGTINKEQLKKQWAEKTIGKELGAKEEQDWEVYDVNTGKTLEIIKGKNKGEVADKIYDKYADQKIGFNVRPYVDPATLTPRAKLAKRIVEPKPQTYRDDDASDWEAVYKPTGRVFDTLAHADTEQALAWRDSVMRNHGFTNVSDILIRRVGQKSNEQQARDANDVPMWEIYEKETGHVVHTFANLEKSSATTQANQWLRDIGAEQPTLFAMRAKMVPNQQDSDSRRDSADLQRRLGVRDVEPNIAQNFEPRRMNYELVSDEDPDRVIHRMPNATADEVRAWIAQQEQGGMPPGFLRTRIVAEAIDPVSGAGAVSPRPVVKKDDPTKKVQPVEPAIRPQAYKSAIGQAISQKDLEDMTSQIQLARRLGDSIMEMEETPPEVLRALNQAAQKNGYKNWADVKANPRSESAVMTVAKLANTILRTTAPHHEKIFYKSKTDENFADGKIKGKSRPGRVKSAGASCSGSVTDLRARAKKYGGERGRMYHWCANMKSGKAKKK